jgi:hypothetical protein
MIEREIWAVASEMIRLHGGNAAIHAAIRADACRDLEMRKAMRSGKGS